MMKSIGKDSLKPGLARRKTVRMVGEDLVESGRLTPDQPIPLAIQPRVDGLSLVGWVSSHVDRVRSLLLEHGALLLRGFEVPDLAAFEGAVAVLGGQPLDYTYRSTPRKEVTGKVYTSTEYPADQSIPMHNEMSYTRSWPMKIAFHCVVAADQGGETPIADSRGVLRRIDPKVRERFASHGVMYVRNYGPKLDLPWQEVFQTDDPREVEAFCRNAGMEFEWKDGDRLRTRQVCQAIARHPETGEDVWFNQAHLFHVSSLPSEVRDLLLEDRDEADLPRNTYYGDGEPILPGDLVAVRAAYAEESVAFPWRPGDIMLLDNMLVAHGRHPYQGSRKIVVCMAEPRNGEPS